MRIFICKHVLELLPNHIIYIGKHSGEEGFVLILVYTMLGRWAHILQPFFDSNSHGLHKIGRNND